MNNTSMNVAEQRQKNMQECGFPYKVTIVIPVYKVEAYLSEAIDSIINQTIGFENIQLILVDDGSPDHSGKICDEYKEKYPDNIIVIHKENGGVSSARNVGLACAEGKYVNQLDSDDRLSENTCEKVYKFFSKHKDATDIVAIPMVYFDARKGTYLNEKFNKGTRVVDLTEEYKIIHLSMSAAFVTLSVAKTIDYDTEMRNMEDGKEIAKILTRKQTIGLVHDCIYYYRKRPVSANNPSASGGGALVSKNYYTDLLRHYSLFIYDYCMKRLGYIPRHTQYTVIFEIMEKIRLRDFPDGVLTKDEKTEFFGYLQQVLIQTDNEVILKHEHMYSEHKNYIFYIKYGRWANIDMNGENPVLRYEETDILDISKNKLKLEHISKKNGNVTIKGALNLFPPIESAELFLKIDGEYFKTEAFQIPQDEIYSLGTKILFRQGFKAEIPTSKYNVNSKIKFYCRLHESPLFMLKNVSSYYTYNTSFDRRDSYLKRIARKIRHLAHALKCKVIVKK